MKGGGVGVWEWERWVDLWVNRWHFRWIIHNLIAGLLDGRVGYEAAGKMDFKSFPSKMPYSLIMNRFAGCLSFF